MIELLLLLIPFIATIFLSLACIKLLKLNPAWGPFAAICTVIIFMCIFGTVEFLRAGAYITFSLCILAFIYTLWTSRKNLKQFFKPLLSPAFVFFIALSLVQILAHFENNTIFTGNYWDEVGHWGYANKVTFLEGNIYNYAQNFASLKTYPPGESVLVYFFIFLQNSFLEWQNFAVYNIALVACLTTLMSNANTYKSIRFWALAIVAYFLPQLFWSSGSAYATIYVDVLLYVVAGAVLTVYYSTPDITVGKTAATGTGLFVLVMLKDFGFIVGLPMALVLAFDLLVCRRQFKRENLIIENKGSRVKYIVFALVVVVLPILARALWSLNIQFRGIWDYSATSNVEKSLLYIDKIKFYIRILKNFISSYFSTHVFGNLNTIVTIFLICVGFIWDHKNQQSFLKKRNIIYVSGFVFVFLFYSGALYYAYIAAMAESVANILHAWPRYIVLPLFAFAMPSIANIFSGNTLAESKKRVNVQMALIIALAVFMLSFIRLSDVPFYIKHENIKFTDRKTIQKDLASFSPYLNKDSDKVYIVSQTNDYKTALLYRYEFYPLIADSSVVSFTSAVEDEVTTGIQSLSPNEWLSILKEKNYTHILVHKSDVYFEYNYGYLFNDYLDGMKEDVSRLYKISDSGDRFNFVSENK